MSEYEFNFPPTPKHREAIGKVVVEFAFLEALLEMAIWQLLSLDPDRGQIVTTPMTFRGRMDTFFAITKNQFTNQESAKALSMLQEYMQEASNQRGDIVHGNWGWGIQQDAPLWVRYRRKGGKIDRQLKIMKAETINQIAANIKAVSDSLVKFLHFHKIHPPPISPTP